MYDVDIDTTQHSA